VVRTRRSGDYIQVNRFGGHKKLKDYFIDQKIPKEERDQQLLVTDGSHIMWILGDGDRISENYKVDETTVKILLMKLVNVEEEENDR
jgi:tRNA(Ile)-lysidine synthase